MSTRNAAIALGQARDIGTIEVGKRADLVAIDGNPLADISNTRRVKLVVAKGLLLCPAALRSSVTVSSVPVCASHDEKGR
jgi:imidazolonepropionase-like amidohydrolase